MAIFKLGAFVTVIVGSIGGTNFKRGASNVIVSNKSFGGSRTTLRQNDKLNFIAGIFKQWSQLTQSLRDDWNQVTLSYFFPDKFGVMKNLTGRQLFSKLSIQLLPVGATVPEPDQINNTLSELTIDNFDLTIVPFKAELQMTVTGLENYVLVQIEVSKKLLLAPIFSRRKVTAFVLAEGAIGFDFTSEILEQFPYINDTYRVRAFVTLMNPSGFKNVAVYVDGDWIA